MNKQKQNFSCTNCHYSTPKWAGCCPECKEWGSFTEVEPTICAIKSTLPGKAVSMKTFNTIALTSQKRLFSGISEWDRVMGNGIMPSSFIVLTGDPGVGKSTLLLQICSHLAQHYLIFYFSTEESLAQVKDRFLRLNHHPSDLFHLSDVANLDDIIQSAQHHKPTLLIIDSIQNCYIGGSQTLPGSIGQLREATFRLMRLAKENDITIFVTGHITKEGIIAGPKTMEHMVDALFYLKREDHWQTRLLRSVKNRFGSINEVGFFEMTEISFQ